MRKITTSISISILTILIYANSAKAYGCLDYGMAYEDFTGYCKCMSGYVMGTNFLGDPYCISGNTYCYDKYGIHSSYDSLTKSCECDKGYFWETSTYGNSCVSGNSKCEDQYGIMANYDSLTGKCECQAGYLFGTDSLGRTQCISDDTYCNNIIGSNSTYNSLTDKCECRYGYELSYKTFGTGYDCQMCSSKYGTHSEYNALLKQCECKDGYTLSEGKCVEKNNSAYFKLKEVNTDKKEAIIKSDYTSNCYLVSYGTGCYSSSIKRYINNDVVINMGTDLYVNVQDWLVLQNDDETCNLTKVKNVNCSLALNETDDYSYTYNYIPLGLPTVNNSSDNITNFISTEKNKLTKIDKSLTNRLKGKILLQVESEGQAWYVNPKTGKRHYMANGNEAFSIMRNLGVGITNADLIKIKSDKTVAKKHSGKIFLQIEDKGQAYYIDFKGLAHYLKDGSEAYRIMRELGLGIKNDDLRKIDIN